MVKNYPSMTVLFAGPNDEEVIQEAKEYCFKNGLTKEDCRIVRTEKQILVILK